MTPDNCPLCGTSVELLRRADPRPAEDRLRARVRMLRQCAEALARGEITPLGLKQEALWMCARCQPLMQGLQRLEPREMRRRIQEEVRRLERAS